MKDKTIGTTLMWGTSKGGVYPLTRSLRPSSSSALVSLRVKGD